MWFVSKDGTVIDIDLNALRKLLSVLDAAREGIDRALEGCSGESPLMEDGDDLAGLGFVACQRYITIVISDLGIEKEAALDKGPRVESSGDTKVSVINAAANAWKHEPEWKDPLREGQFKTLERLGGGAGNPKWQYKFANALCELSPDNRFAGVIPALEKWRDVLRAESSLDRPPMPYWLSFEPEEAQIEGGPAGTPMSKVDIRSRSRGPR